MQLHDTKCCECLARELFLRGATKVAVYSEGELNGRATSPEGLRPLLMQCDEEIVYAVFPEEAVTLCFYMVYGNSPGETVADHSEHPLAHLIWEICHAASS
jgi:hypothetical protein